MAGNLLVALLYAANSSTTAFGAPGGWTILSSNMAGTNAGESAVATKTATSSEPGSYTFTGTGFICGAIMQFSGTIALDGSVTYNAVASATTACTAPSVTAAQTGDGLIVAFGSDGGKTFTTPAGMSAGPNAFSDLNCSIYGFYQILSASGATGAASSTQSASKAYTGWSLLLAPSVVTVNGTATVALGPLTVAAHAAAAGGCSRGAWLTLGPLTIPLEDQSAGYFCQSLDLGYPQSRDVVNNRPDQDGADDRTQYMGSRVVTANITALAGAGARIDAVAASFAPYMQPSARPVLHYVLDRPGSPERVLGLRGLASSWPIAGPSQRDIHLQWVAADPIARDPAVQTTTATPAATAVILSPGDVPPRPVFRITGPITAPAITLTPTTGAVWRLAFLSSFAVAAGHFVAIDTAARTVYLDGDPAQPRLASLDWTVSSWQWLPVAPATSTMALTGTGTTGATQVTASWQDGYLT